MDRVQAERAEKEGSCPSDFRIVESEAENNADLPLLPPDLPVCEECLAEMKKPGDSRYRYPFISCVNCGPRYSIMEAVPYDRAHITMRKFAMCPSCRKEYAQMGNRRRHAQTISCHDCGPQLCWKARGMKALLYTGKRKRRWRRLCLFCKEAGYSLKGIGGYQFSCRPDNADSVDRLRQLKHRDKKPFAVMFPSMESIREVCMVSEQEEALLFFTGPADCASESEKGQVRLRIGSERREPVPGSLSSLHGAASDAYRSRRASGDDQRQCDG